jgi:hypothetical protein
MWPVFPFHHASHRSIGNCLVPNLSNRGAKAMLALQKMGYHTIRKKILATTTYIMIF